MSFIFSKESIIKQFPNLGQEYIQPLFIEGGNMQDSKKAGKSKSCQIYINNAGIFFLRPIKLSKLFKISLFLPSFSIKKLYFINHKRRTIESSYRIIFFECPHIDEAINFIVTSKNTIYPYLDRVIFVNFPRPPDTNQIPIPTENVSLIKYASYCILKEENIESSACQYLSNLNTQISRTITLDSNLVLLNKCNCFVRSLNLIRVVCLKNFMPYTACRCVHFFIKRLPRISRILFEGYSILVPNQLKMENLEPQIPLSFCFVNCKFSDDCFIELIENIS